MVHASCNPSIQCDEYDGGPDRSDVESGRNERIDEVEGQIEGYRASQPAKQGFHDSPTAAEAESGAGLSLP